MLPHCNWQGNGYEKERPGFDTYQLKLSRIEGCLGLLSLLRNPILKPFPKEQIREALGFTSKHYERSYGILLRGRENFKFIFMNVKQVAQITKLSFTKF